MTLASYYDKFHRSLDAYLVTPFQNLDKEPSRIKAACKAYVIHPFANLALSTFHATKTIECAATAIYYLATSIISGIGAAVCLGRSKKINDFYSDQKLKCALSIVVTPLSLSCLAINIAACAISFFDFQTASRIESTAFVGNCVIHKIRENPNCPFE